LHLVCVQVSLPSCWKCNFKSFKCHTHVARLEKSYNGQTILVCLDSLKKNSSWYVCVKYSVYEMNPKENIEVLQNTEVVKHFRCCGGSCLSSEIDRMIFARHILHTYWCFLMSACSPLSPPFIITALSYVWLRMLFSCRSQSPRNCFTFEIMWNANLMQQGNFIDVFLAWHVSGAYPHHQEHWMLSCSIWFSAAALKTTTHPQSRCRKPYAATQHPVLLMMEVCAQNMSS